MAQIRLFWGTDDVEDFSRWLNANGHDAVIAGGDQKKVYIDGKCNRETRKTIETLFERFQRESRQ